MSKFAKITKGDGFSKDLKKLLKRYRSLEDDLENFIKAQLFAYHKLQVDNHGVFPINNLGFESPQVYKAKKFACKALKGKGAKSCIRVIYAYIPENEKDLLNHAGKVSAQIAEKLWSVTKNLTNDVGKKKSKKQMLKMLLSLKRLKRRQNGWKNNQNIKLD